MTRYLALLMALVGAVLFAVPASADGLPRSRGKTIAAEPAPSGPIYLPQTTPKDWSWTGVYVGLGVGGMAAISDLDFARQGYPTEASLNGFGSWDYLGDAKAGADWQPANSPFVFGIFGGHNLGSTRAEASIGDDFEASLELTPLWNVGARIGLVGPNRSLVYLGYKYQVADLDVRATGGHRVSRQVDSHGLITGFEQPITPVFTVALEYNYQPYDLGEIGTESLSVRGDSDVHAVMLRGNVRIGPNLFD